MAKLTGFMDYARKTSTDVPPLERIENFNEFHIWLSREEQQTAGGTLHGLRRALLSGRHDDRTAWPPAAP